MQSADIHSRISGGRRGTAGGFTLLEALVASVMLAGALVTLCGINTRCLSQTRLNRAYDEAWQVLDRQMTLIEYSGIDAFIDEGVTDGEIEQFGRQYYWQAAVSTLEIGNLYRVTLRVSWISAGQAHRVQATTEFNGKRAVLIE